VKVTEHWSAETWTFVRDPQKSISKRSLWGERNHCESRTAPRPDHARRYVQLLVLGKILRTISIHEDSNMKRVFLLGFAIFILSQMSYPQKKQLRTLNEVVSSFYKPWDEEKLNTKIPANLLRDDIDLFVERIEEIGVNPYVNITKDSFYREIDLLKRKIDKPLTRREFIEQIVPIVGDLRLSHTLVKPDWWVYKSVFDKKGGTYLPVDVNITDYRLLIEKDYSDLHLAEGEEIISINNIKSKTLIDSLVRYSTSSTRHSRLMDVQADFSLLLVGFRCFRLIQD
jgi:hypothetical protein